MLHDLLSRMGLYIQLLRPGALGEGTANNPRSGSHVLNNRVLLSSALGSVSKQYCNRTGQKNMLATHFYMMSMDIQPFNISPATYGAAYDMAMRSISDLVPSGF